MQAAAESGVVDAIMLQYTPWIDKDSPLNKAIDACWKKGIGLISMKQIAGNTFGDRDAPKRDILKEVVAKVPRSPPNGSSPRSRACCTRSGATSGSPPRAFP